MEREINNAKKGSTGQRKSQCVRLKAEPEGNSTEKEKKTHILRKKRARDPMQLERLPVTVVAEKQTKNSSLGLKGYQTLQPTPSPRAASVLARAMTAPWPGRSEKKNSPAQNGGSLGAPIGADICDGPSMAWHDSEWRASVLCHEAQEQKPPELRIVTTEWDFPPSTRKSEHLISRASQSRIPPLRSQGQICRDRGHCQ